MRILSILLVGFVFALTAYSAEETTSIFNGKDLAGWEGNPELWSVKDGVITGITGDEPHNKIKHNTFLIWKGGDVTDFEFKCKYKLVGGNSGIQYRSKVTAWTNLLGQAKYGPRVVGYQADFASDESHSGILYEEGGRGILCNRGEKVKWNADNKKEVVGKTEKTSAELQAAINKEDWNDYVIIANGNKLVHMINGNVTAEIIDESPKGSQSGVLALQIHAGFIMTVQFKELTLKKLASSPVEKKN